MRVFIHTFGCKVNQYDSEFVRQALEARGAVVVSDPAAADAAVVNSCTVTHVGEAKMRGFVRRLDRVRPGIRTVVIGCAASLDDGTLASLPGVVRVVGGTDPEPVLETLGMDSTPVPPLLERFPRGARAWLKIQDGCDEHCTFCATTLARGANRSRLPDEIVAEALGLSREHEEIVITGVHIGTYGADLDGPTLSGLVERLVRDVPGVRFRLSSVEATEVDDGLIELMTGAPDRLAPHLHAPLQSGSDPVLKRMGRHWYTAAGYAARCLHVAGQLPAFGLGADVIVGFPGETHADHVATAALVRDLPYTYLHVFPYSQRPGAAATRLGPPVDPRLAAERSAELREIVGDKARAYRMRRSGAPADVIVLNRTKGKYRGLTEDYLDVYLPVERPVPTRFTGTLLAGHDDTTVEYRDAAIA